MHPFTESGIAAAQASARKCREAIEKAIRERSNADAWALIGQALFHVTHVEAHLADAMTLDEMATTTGEENAAE